MYCITPNDFIHRALGPAVITLLLLLCNPVLAREAPDTPISQNSVKLLTSLANLGRQEAQFTLAKLFLYGNGVTKDPEQAIAWFIKAAKKGHAEAKNFLGIIYINGSETKIDCKKSIYWFNQVPSYSYNYNKIQINLAWTLSTCPDNQYRNSRQALNIIQHVNEQSGRKSPALLDVMAAVYAEADQFSLAITTQQQAIQLLIQKHEKGDRINRFKLRLLSYQQHKPWRSMNSAL